MNTDCPLVSVVIPTYNRASTISRAIDSVLNQSYGNLELIIVDDGSIDGTVDIVKAYSDPRVKLIELLENSGPSVARNCGVEAAIGEFLAFQDSDDEWLHDKLAIQMTALLDDPELGFVSATIIRWLKGSNQTQLVPPDLLPSVCNKNKLLNRLLRKNYAWTQTWVMRRNIFDEIGGFDPNVSRIEDWDFVIRVTQKYKVEHISQPLVLVNQMPGSLLSDKALLVAGYEFLLEKYHELLKSYPSQRAAYHRAIAYHQFECGHTRKARRHALATLRANPRSVRNWVFFVLASSGARVFNFFRQRYESRFSIMKNSESGKELRG